MAIELLIADIDGTLIDTVELIQEGHYRTAKSYFVARGMAERDFPSAEEYRRHWGVSVGGSVRSTLEATLAALFADAPERLVGVDFDEMVDHLRALQDELTPQYVRAYPGLEELFYGVGREGLGIVLATSGSAHHVVRNFGTILPRLDVRGRADLAADVRVQLREFERLAAKMYGIRSFHVLTSEDVTAHKPDPEVIHAALRLGRAQGAQAAMLGDHMVDMVAARDAGVAVRIGVTHGFDDEQTLQEAGATCIVHSLAEVPAALANR